eukprot:scaffold3421_cov181-Amphora_coffeaeformis.AAC.24
MLAAERRKASAVVAGAAARALAGDREPNKTAFATTFNSWRRLDVSLEFGSTWAWGSTLHQRCRRAGGGGGGVGVHASRHVDDRKRKQLNRTHGVLLVIFIGLVGMSCQRGEVSVLVFLPFFVTREHRRHGRVSAWVKLGDFKQEENESQLLRSLVGTIGPDSEKRERFNSCQCSGPFVAVVGFRLSSRQSNRIRLRC